MHCTSSKFTSTNTLSCHINLIVLFTYVLAVTSLVLTPKSELSRLPLLRGGEAYGMSRRPEYVHHGCHPCQGEKEVFSCRSFSSCIMLATELLNVLLLHTSPVVWSSRANVLRAKDGVSIYWLLESQLRV